MSTNMPWARGIGGYAPPAGNGGNGNGNAGGDPGDVGEGVSAACGCAERLTLRGLGGLLFGLRNIMKSGNINQGYAVCDADPLAMRIAKGECPVERVQCRARAPLVTTAVAGGATVTFTVTPVGPAFARELLCIASGPDAPGAPNARFIIEQISGAGRITLTGTTAGGGASNVGTGSLANSWSRSWQNYVLPTGIMFDSSTPLSIVVRNVGTDAGSFEAELTYDVIRAG